MWYLLYIHFSVPTNFVSFVYLDIFSLTQFCFDEYLIYFNFCVILLNLFIRHILNTIYKSMHWHFCISVRTANFYFSLIKIFFDKVKHLWPRQLLCSIVWHQHHFATITYFSMISFSSIQWQPFFWIFRALIH